MSGRAWLVMLVAGLVAVAAYLLVPAGPPADALYVGIGVASVAAVVAGVLRHQPVGVRPWTLMAIGLGTWVLGDAVYSLPDLFASVPAAVVSVGDLSYLLGYALFAAAMLSLAQHRSPRGDRAADLDALLVAGGLGLLAYELLVRPSVHVGDSLLSLLVTIGYPCGDVALLAALVRVMVAPGTRTSASRLLLGAVGLLVAADVANSAATIYSGDSPAPLQLLWLASYVVWGAAALHPSMTRVTEGSRTAAPFGPVRLAAVGAAVLAAPLMLAVQRAFGLAVDVWGVVVAAVVLFGLVVGRMYLAIRQMATSEQVRSGLQRQLAHDASHDHLTGLPNRAHGLRMVETALHRARRSGATVALLFVDLDGFKRVNDTHGHSAGDELLVQVGRRLVESVRGGDVVARLGGDEFIVLLEPVDDPPAAMVAAQRMVADLAQPFDLSAADAVAIGASIGVAVNSGLGTSAEAMLHHADLAAYRAKSGGKGRADLYDIALREAVAEQAALEAAIRLGIESEELRAFYQPIVGVRSRRVLGYEALVRWERPGFGIVPPAEFVAVAEQSDLISDLDTWVLTRACADFAGWTEDLFEEPVYVSVNVSARHLTNPRVIGDVSRALAASGLPADRLIVEVTETSMADELRSVEHLRELRTMGVKIAIDDFGTGYSSLARLQEMPADLLKIDRSFLDESRSGWLDVLRLIVGAAHAVGLRSIAEGVENAEQLATLDRLGCDAVQGYHLARPMPASAVPGFHRVALSR